MHKMGIKSYAIYIIKQHRIFAFIFLFLVIVRLPLLFHIPGYVLLGQDFNPVHWAHFYWDKELWPAIDDHDAGENARTILFSTAYFYVPALAYKFGVPVEIFLGIHLLFGLPLLLLGIYSLSYALFRDPHLASFGALHFGVAKWVFGLSVGYPILFDRQIYYGDFNHIFAVGLLVSLFQQRFNLAAASCFLLTLFNITYGVSGCLILGSVLGSKALRNRSTSGLILPSLIVGLGLMTAWAMIRLATPVHAPISEAIRNFCILAYGHVTPHIFTAQWVSATVILLVILLGSLAFERFARQRIYGAENFFIYQSLVILISLFIVYGLLLYFWLYVYYPNLFIMLSPCKIVFFFVFVANVYFCYGLFAGLADLRFAIPIFGFYGYFLWRFGTYGGARADILLLLCFGLSAVAVALFSLNRVKPYTAWWLYAPILILLVILNVMPIYSREQSARLVHAEAFHDIQLDISASLPHDAVLIPYRLPGSSNTFGPGTSYPMRTYSRRAAMQFWYLGRNAYVNSQHRLNREFKCYSEAGINVWDEILVAADKAEKEDWFLYYFGIKTKPCCSVQSSSSVWQVFEGHVNKMMEYLAKLDLKQYADFGRRIGATHVIVCRDPGQTLDWGQIVVENPYFAVIDIAASIFKTP